jgi:hypothetical protein
MPRAEHTFLIAYFDELSAMTAQRMLELEGVRTELRSDTTLLGVARTCSLYVPDKLFDRARSLLGSQPVSDAELLFLATGELGDGESGPQD